MSGHNKWSKIKNAKEKNDQQNAKMFTKIGREIAVAVKAGGSDPNSNSQLKNIIQKAKAMIPILVPLFVSAFRRANDLAMAMEARCYRGGTGRTKMKPLVYKKQDYIAYGIAIAYVIVAVVIGKL